MISELKQDIDIVPIIEGSGVVLKRQGHHDVGLCPFHDDRNPSFYVFTDTERFKCFGCGESGDTIDFVMKFYNLGFKQALKFLGITQGKITPKIRREIEQRKQKAEAVKRFRKWEIQYAVFVGDMIFQIEKLVGNGIPPEDFEYYALLFHRLPILHYHQSILMSKNDRLKFALYMDVCRDE